jgi:hypothetical protein
MASGFVPISGFNVPGPFFPDPADRFNFVHAYMAGQVQTGDQFVEGTRSGKLDQFQIYEPGFFGPAQDTRNILPKTEFSRSPAVNPREEAPKGKRTAPEPERTGGRGTPFGLRLRKPNAPRETTGLDFTSKTLLGG